MTKRLRIPCASKYEVPDDTFLRENARWDQQIVLEFPSQIVGSRAKSKIIRRLSFLLPKHTVIDSGGGGATKITLITISRVLTEADVLEHLSDVVHAIQDFRELATGLANRVANHFQVLPGSLVNWNSSAVKQGGTLDNEWGFYFHGYECYLWSQTTKQSIKILLEFDKEFGAVTPHYFTAFIQSTQRLAHLSSMLYDFRSTARVFGVLERQRVLRRIPSTQRDTTSGVILA